MESGGTLTGSDTVTVSGQTTWTYGTMSGTGTTVADGGLAITVSSDGSVLLDNRTLTNAGIGTLSSSGSNSALEAGDNAIINNLSGATFDVQNSIGINTNYHVPGSATFNNQGTLTKSTGSGTTTISAALNNTGTVSVQSGTLDVTGTFTNFSGTILTGGSYIVNNSNFQFNNANIQTNAANITLDGASAAIVDQNGANALANFSTNTGSLTLLDGNQVTTSGDFSNQGNVTIDATGGPSQFSAGGNLTQSGNGSITLVADGTLVATSSVNLQGGTLQGTGTVNANVTNGGTVSPGTTTNAGKITINGTYTQSSGGSFNVKIGGRTTPGTDYDQLVVSGAATLGGTINVSVINGFTPQPGDQYQILTFASSSGDFATKNGFYLGGGNILSEQFSPLGLALVVNQAKLIFLTEPGNSVAGQSINPDNPVQVEVLDGNGNPVTSDNTDVIALTLNQNSFDPASTLTATVSGGIATFNNLVIDQAAAGYQITATSPGLGSAVSSLFTVNPVGTTLAAANATATFSTSSQSVSLSATVTSGTLTVNEGTVTFSVFKGATQIGTSVTSGTVSGGNVSASFTLPGGTAVGTYTIQAIYNPGPDFLTSSDNTHTLTVNPAGPALISTTVNGADVTIAGQSVSLAGTQRSMVDNIVFQFNEAVTLDPGAFTIALHAGVSVNGGAPGTVGTLPTLSWTSPDGGLTWVVSFRGAGVVGGSIADGDYDITVVSTAVHANGQTMTSNVTNTFFRLFGDTNGDGQVSSRPDLVAMQSALGTSIGQAGYLAYLDYNGDGIIAGRPDFWNFQSRLGTIYTDLSATI